MENDDYGPSKYQEIFAQRHSEDLNPRVPMGGGHAVAQLVEALRYKPEGRGFDSRLCHWA